MPTILILHSTAIIVLVVQIRLHLVDYSNGRHYIQSYLYTVTKCFIGSAEWNNGDKKLTTGT